MGFITFLKSFACVCVLFACNTMPLLKGSNYTEDNARDKGSKDLLLLSNDVKNCSALSFQRKA